MKLLKGSLAYFDCVSVKQLLESHSIPCLIKASYGLGAEYMGEAVPQDLFVSDDDYEAALELLKTDNQ